MQNHINRQTSVNQRNTVRQIICATALYLAAAAVRKGQMSFQYMGKLFNLTEVSEREYYVTCSGHDAGIRIYDGIAELA